MGRLPRLGPASRHAMRRAETRRWWGSRHRAARSRRGAAQSPDTSHPPFNVTVKLLYSTLVRGAASRAPLRRPRLAAGRPSRARQRCEDRPRLRAGGQRYEATLRAMCLSWSELPVRWNVRNVPFSEFRGEFEGL